MENGEKSQVPILCRSTGGVDDLYGFSTGNDEGMLFHSRVFLFHAGCGICGQSSALPFGVDIGLDFLDRLGKRGVLFHFLLHLLDGIEHGGFSAGPG